MFSQAVVWCLPLDLNRWIFQTPKGESFIPGRMDMSADVPSKEALDQAGVLAGWLRENDQWRSYRGSAEIAQCSHPDRTQRVKPVINAMNVAVSSDSPLYSCSC